MKKILISGSSSGIGRAIAERMLTEGHVVIGLARDHQKFQPPSKRYIAQSIDFSNIESLSEHLKSIQKKHGALDAVVSSCGYGEFIELDQFSIEQMQTMMNVNFLSQAILIKHFLPEFKRKKFGNIIFIGSECALEGYKKGTMYCASKFALRGFAQSLRKECVSASISVTLINPGMVDTPFFSRLSFQPGADDAHAIEPDQVASLVSMILNEKNNCVYEEINMQPMKKFIQKK